jgi:hypothetical protein
LLTCPSKQVLPSPLYYLALLCLHRHRDLIKQKWKCKCVYSR